MKIKTSELTGAALDWAVTTIEAPDALAYGIADWREQRKRTVKNSEYVYRWHQSWSQGGPIIEREFLAIEGDYNEWRARLFDDGRIFEADGPTPLVAAMRCYVASKLGDEVDVPKELI